MSEYHSGRHINEFTETGAQPLVHIIQSKSVSNSVESLLVSFPASVKHSVRPPSAMYRTRSPQKGRQEAAPGSVEGSLDHALQAIREQLSVLANERRVVEARIDTLASGTRTAYLQFTARRSFTAVRAAVANDSRAVRKATTVIDADEVDYHPTLKKEELRTTSRNLSSVSSSVEGSHESLLSQNSPDAMRDKRVSTSTLAGTPTYYPHVIAPTEAPRHSHATFESLKTPSRPNSIVSESSFNLPFASQLSIDKIDEDDDRTKYYSSSLALDDTGLSPTYRPDLSVRHAHSDSKRPSGSTTIVRRSSETGQMEHFRKPNRYMSFSSTKVGVAPVQSRRNNSPHHEKSKCLKGSRTSVILPSIETTV